MDERPYYFWLLKMASTFAAMTAGIFLIIEHYLTWGYLQFEPKGHETYGLILIILGILGILKWKHNPLKTESQEVEP